MLCTGNVRTAIPDGCGGAGTGNLGMLSGTQRSSDESHHSIPEKEAVVRKVFPEAVQDLLCVLCKNAETADVPEIFQAFYEKKRQSESCVHAVVEYVTPLTEAQQEGLKQFAMKVTGKQQAVLTMQKNPALRGGFVLRIGDLVYDRSLRNTLKTLQKKLAGQ